MTHTGSGEKAENQRSLTRFVRGTTIEKPPNTDGVGLMAILIHPLSILLLALPLGIASSFREWGPVATFFLIFAALIPLAKILGDATEELAAGLRNEMLAGLLNATFGNAVEVVIMIQTLRAGLTDIVKATLLGSVLSNLLLVLGMSFFCGGIVSSAPSKQQFRDAPGQLAKNQMEPVFERIPSAEIVESKSFFVGEKVQSFSTLSAMVNTSMLLVSCLTLSLVTVFYSETTLAHLHRDTQEDEVLIVSRICSIIIMAAYCAYIFFQLVTHKQALAEDDEEDAEEEQPALSVSMALTVMLVSTVIVAYSTQLLVDTIEGVTTGAGISEHFIGIILLPIVGNACEHASAVRFAIMDKPGLSIGIAVGSSTQIALFVVPFSVIIGWLIHQPMDLNFGSLNTTVLSVSVIVVLSVVVDGNANWLQGYLLTSCYLVIAVLYWFVPNSMKTNV